MRNDSISRILTLPTQSFFLLGPRGTGKSTWLRQKLPDAPRISLLSMGDYLKFTAHPERLVDELKGLKKGDWFVIDEIQKAPALLNEVHLAIEERGIRFALTGSSARKLRRHGENLLAGRALHFPFFPFVYPEVSERFDIGSILEWGSLPVVRMGSPDPAGVLEAYVHTYLKQEIQEEGLVRGLDSFARFLEVMGRLHAQIINLENVSREAHVKRPTLTGYLEILQDTLIGCRLEAYQAGAKVREIQQSKFYFFDGGVARACGGYAREEMDAEQMGFQLETYVFHEIRAYNEWKLKKRRLGFYRVSGGEEIDFIIETRRKTISRPAEILTLEVKHAKRWKKEWAEPARNLASSPSVKVQGMYGVYLGTEMIESDGFFVFPLEIFLKKLWDGEIF